MTYLGEIFLGGDSLLVLSLGANLHLREFVFESFCLNDFLSEFLKNIDSIGTATVSPFFNDRKYVVLSMCPCTCIVP